MSENGNDGRLETLVEACMDCLEEGDLTGAVTALEKARLIAKDHPDLLSLEIAVAEAEGDDERALELCARAAKLSPDDPMPLLSAAAIHFHGQGEHGKALKFIDQALELIEEEDDLIGAVTLKADVLVDRGGPKDLELARETLAELSTSAIDDAGVLIDIAELWLAADAADRAKVLAQQIIDGEEASEDDVLRADALYLLGRTCDAQDDAAGRTAAWLEVRKLDNAQPRPDWHLTEADFDARARVALELLTPEAQKLLSNVPILVEAGPSAELITSGVDPRLLGLFEGTPLPAESAVGGVPTLNTIHLFQHNLEHAAGDEDDLDEQIIITVLHETAHFFGLEEDDLGARGLD